MVPFLFVIFGNFLKWYHFLFYFFSHFAQIGSTVFKATFSISTFWRQKVGGGGGASILMYTHYMKKPTYTYTLIYINIHKLSFYSALSVNHIMHLNDVFEELLHCINSFDGRFVDI